MICCRRCGTTRQGEGDLSPQRKGSQVSAAVLCLDNTGSWDCHQNDRFKRRGDTMSEENVRKQLATLDFEIQLSRCGSSAGFAHALLSQLAGIRQLCEGCSDEFVARIAP